MTLRSWTAVLAAGAVSMAVAACGSGSDSGNNNSSASASGSKAGAVPSSALVEKGKLQFCSDISTPPLESYGPGHKPEGSDIDIGNEIAKRLGLQAVWKNTAFAGIIPALQAGNCDAIVSQLFDKPERRKVVDFVDYLKSGQAVLVGKGNPQGIQGIDSLCGKTVAAENGTTIADLLRAQSAKCQSSGGGKITVRLFLRDADALQQLALKQVDAYGTTTETVSFVSSKQPDKYEVAGSPFAEINAGIATKKGNTALHDAIDKVFTAMQQDGTYSRILAKWKLNLDELKD